MNHCVEVFIFLSQLFLGYNPCHHSIESCKNLCFQQIKFVTSRLHYLQQIKLMLMISLQSRLHELLFTLRSLFYLLYSIIIIPFFNFVFSQIAIEFSDVRMISSENFLYVKEDLIIPHVSTAPCVRTVTYKFSSLCMRRRTTCMLFTSSMDLL